MFPALYSVQVPTRTCKTEPIKAHNSLLSPASSLHISRIHVLVIPHSLAVQCPKSTIRYFPKKSSLQFPFSSANFFLPPDINYSLPIFHQFSFQIPFSTPDYSRFVKVPLCRAISFNAFLTGKCLRTRGGGNIYIIFYLNINQLDALNFIMSLFHASTCFEHTCSSSGGQNYTILPLVSSH